MTLIAFHADLERLSKDNTVGHSGQHYFLMVESDAWSGLGSQRLVHLFLPFAFSV